MPNEAQEFADRAIEAWPRVVKLRSPIDFGKDDRITKLEFRKGRLGDLKGIKIDAVPTADQVILIASRMCNQPVGALEMLDPDDGAEVMEIALGFFSRCLGAGGTR